MAYVSLSPVSKMVYATLNVPAVTSLAIGGVTDDPAQNIAPPFLWYEVSERRGGGLGLCRLPEVDLRLHAFAPPGAIDVAQAVLAAAVPLLADTRPSVTGYATCAIFHDATVTLGPVEINGTKLHEIVALLRVYVEETT